MSKHYIRVNENNYIVYGFSDVFETPLETDICICENGKRHFEIDKEINPALFDVNGKPLYKFIDNLVTKLKKEEIDLISSFRIDMKDVTK